MFVLYIDAYQLGDPLFLTGLARDLHARHTAGGDGIILVHGAGEAGERAIEASGEEPVRDRGALRLSTPEAALRVERAARELNRSIVHELSEAGVPALRVTGMDRGLVQPDGTVGRTQWLHQLTAQRTTPVVVSLVARGSDQVIEADPAALAAQIGTSVGAEMVVALGSPDQPSGTISLESAERFVPDPEALRRMVSGGTHVRISRRAALRAPGLPQGVDVGIGTT